MSDIIIKVFVEDESMEISVDYGESISGKENDCSIDLVRFSLIFH